MGASGQVSACLELLLYTSAFPSGHHGLYQEFLEWSVITLSKSTVTKAEAQLALGSPHTSPAWGNSGFAQDHVTIGSVTAAHARPSVHRG